MLVTQALDVNSDCSHLAKDAGRQWHLCNKVGAARLMVDDCCHSSVVQLQWQTSW